MKVSLKMIELRRKKGYIFWLKVIRLGCQLAGLSFVL